MYNIKEDAKAAETVSAEDVPIELKAEHRSKGMVAIESAVKTSSSLSPFKPTEGSPDGFPARHSSVHIPKHSGLLKQTA